MQTFIFVQYLVGAYALGCATIMWGVDLAENRRLTTTAAIMPILALGIICLSLAGL